MCIAKVCNYCGW